MLTLYGVHNDSFANLNSGLINEKPGWGFHGERACKRLANGVLKDRKSGQTKPYKKRENFFLPTDGNQLSIPIQ